MYVEEDVPELQYLYESTLGKGPRNIWPRFTSTSGFLRGAPPDGLKFSFSCGTEYKHDVGIDALPMHNDTLLAAAMIPYLYIASGTQVANSRTQRFNFLTHRPYAKERILS